MPPTPTPRTDTEEGKCNDSRFNVTADFARQLERELVHQYDFNVEQIATQAKLERELNEETKRADNLDLALQATGRELSEAKRFNANQLQIIEKLFIIIDPSDTMIADEVIKEATRLVKDRTQWKKCAGELADRMAGLTPIINSCKCPSCKALAHFNQLSKGE